MNNNCLYHHGIKGQKWGVRRYQNEDGSLTSIGAKRYSNNSESNRKSEKKVSDSKMSTGKKVALGAAVVAASAGITYAAIRNKNRQIHIENGRKMVDEFLRNQKYNNLFDTNLMNQMTTNARNEARSKAINKAKRDSFGQAAKNVMDYYRRR